MATQDPPKDELANKRADRNGHPDAPPKSMEDLEADGTAEQITEDDGQEAFVLEQGKKVTLGTLIGRNVPVTYEVKLTGRTLKGPGSLLAFSDPDVTLVALGRAGRVITDPTYNEDGSVKAVHVSQEIKTRTFYDARTEAAQVALHGEE